MTNLKSNNSGNLFPSVWSDFFDNDKFFNRRWLDSNFETSVPAVNIKENNNEFSLEFAAPGFNKSDFKINVEENRLIISAEKSDEKKEEKGQYTRKEFSYNSFSRVFDLPATVNADRIDAGYKDGILTLNIPKKEETKKQMKREISVA